MTVEKRETKPKENTDKVHTIYDNCFSLRVSPQPGVPPEEAGTVVAAESSTEEIDPQEAGSVLPTEVTVEIPTVPKCHDDQGSSKQPALQPRCLFPPPERATHGQPLDPAVIEPPARKCKYKSD
ncbi:hypothetical protein AgCh_018317 [Apium graveolens]